MLIGNLKLPQQNLFFAEYKKKYIANELKRIEERKKKEAAAKNEKVPEEVVKAETPKDTATATPEGKLLVVKEMHEHHHYHYYDTDIIKRFFDAEYDKKYPCKLPMIPEDHDVIDKWMEKGDLDKAYPNW